MPLTLLVAFLAIVAGIVGWLSLTSPEAVIADEEPAATSAPEPASDADAGTESHAAASPAGEPAPPPPPAGSTEAAAPDPPGPAQTDEAHEAPPAAEPMQPKPHPEPEKPAVVTPATEVPPTPEPDAERATEPKPEREANQPTEEKTAAPRPPTAAAPATTPRPAAPRKTVQIAKLPPVSKDAPLPPAPDPDLIQETSVGPLPQRSADGRAPWRVYAKPFDAADKRPRVAIVVTGLGLSAAATESAIQGLPGSVTLAFAPYTTDLNRWIGLARAAGHEVLLNVPMEPLDYPNYDPGPQTLLTSLNEQGNLDRLFWILSRGTGYVGVIDFMGTRFTMSRPHLAPVLSALRDRGLLYLDSGAGGRSAVSRAAPDIGIPWAATTIVLDEHASRVEIDSRFGALEREAKRAGRAIGIASPYPVSLERIAAWTRQLSARGIAIAPVSAMVQADGSSGGAR